MLNQNQVIYQIFPRQYSKKQNFQGIIDDLDRIKDLGVDVIYLLPIFPIGKVNRKGSLGSPYSIRDYEAINPEYGTIDDFKLLIDKAHQKGLKLIIDVALNHTACDSKLLREHPEYFYHKDGKVARKCDDWSDVYDLDYRNKELFPIITNGLKKWVLLGVDGFRMDVSSLVPIEFWRYFKEEIAKINPNIIMIGEAVAPEFLDYIKTCGTGYSEDKDCVGIFDALYQYNMKKFDVVHNGEINAVSDYLNELVNDKTGILRLRYLDNHDIIRIAHYYKLKDLIKLWSFAFFIPGVPFIYASDEYQNKHLESLFDTDLIKWNYKSSLHKIMKNLIRIRHFDIFVDSDFEIINNENNFIVLKYQKNNEKLIGIFNFSDEVKYYESNVDLLNLIDNKIYKTKGNVVEIKDMPIIFKELN